MTWPVIVMALGAFLAGGAYSFHKQGFPRVSVVVLALAAGGLIVSGAAAWLDATIT